MSESIRLSSRALLRAMLCVATLSIPLIVQVDGQEAATTREIAPKARELSIFAGQSQIIDSPWPVKRVSVSDPTVADVDVTSPRRVQIQGKAPGSAEITLWSEQGEIWQARVEVEADLSRLQSQLQKMLPQSDIKVTQIGSIVVIKGELARAEHVVQLRRFLELAKLEYVDATRVAGVHQVQLQVKVAEVSRTALRALNINTFYGGKDMFGGVQLGSSSGPFTSMNMGPAEGGAAGSIPFVVGEGGISVPPSATIFAGFPNSDLQFFIQALSENQYLRVLAEPTLVAMSGQEASFLAGGEIPIPIAQVGGGGNTEISIEYKEFGVRLRFRPTVLGDGKILLKVVPEVSQLSDVGALQLLGTRIPSLLTRRVETELELQSGQTFAIAGLISQKDDATSSRVPGLGDLPILGTMFRSVRYQRDETELLVLVTAALVAATSQNPDVPVPGVTHQAPNDWELYIKGKIAGRSVPLAAAHAEHLQRLGFDKLQGPGGWANHNTASGAALAGEGSSARKAP